MKTAKAALAAIVLVLSVSGAKAQTANLKVTLNDFLTVTAATEATITYAGNASAYGSDQNSTGGSVTVSSLLPYKVSVATVANATNLVNGTNNIPVSVVTVTGPGTSATITQSATNAAVSTTTATPTLLYTTNTGTLSTTQTITYSIASSQVAANILNKPAGDYTVSLIYTVSH